MIADCFTYSGEDDVAEIRLNVLSPVVDRFVVVEAARTFRDEPRDLTFPALMQSRLDGFNGRVQYLPVDAWPPGLDPWAREAWLRDYMREGDLGDGLVLVSDCDEVPDPDKLALCSQAAERRPVSFAMAMHYFRLDLRTPWDSRNLPVLTTASRLRDLGGERVRTEGAATKVHGGGWEWSWLGDAAANVRKLRSFSHAELDVEEARDPAFFERALAELRDPWGRFEHRPVEIGPGYPQWLRDNLGRYPHLLWRAQ